MSGSLKDRIPLIWTYGTVWSQLGFIEELARFSWSLTSRWLVSSFKVQSILTLLGKSRNHNPHCALHKRRSHEKDVSLNKGAGSQSLLLLDDKLISSKSTTLFCYDIGDLNQTWVFVPLMPSDPTIHLRDGRSHSFAWYPFWQVTNVHRAALAN